MEKGLYTSEDQQKQQFCQINKLSELLAVALHDMKAVEKRKSLPLPNRWWYYPINVSGYKKPRYELCAASAVILNRLPLTPLQRLHGASALDFPDPIRHRLYAINALQGAGLSSAYLSLFTAQFGTKVRQPLQKPKELVHVGTPVVPYWANREDFYWDLEQLQMRLITAGH